MRERKTMNVDVFLEIVGHFFLMLAFSVFELNTLTRFEYGDT